jgi:hypothetical protein
MSCAEYVMDNVDKGRPTGTFLHQSTQQLHKSLVVCFISIKYVNIFHLLVGDYISFLISIFMQNMPCFARDKFHAKMKNKRVMFVETKERELCVFHLHNGTYKTHIFREDYKRVLIDYNMKHGDKIKLTLNTKDHYVFLHPLDKNGFPKKEGWRCITYL